MKKILILAHFISLLLIYAMPVRGQDLPAAEIVRKANDKFNGEKSGYSEMAMTVVRPTWERTVNFKSWMLGTEFSLTLITAPAREKGQTFLKRGNEMWNWNPAINRLIKLPPSMMSQGWMGSDYTNDDILKESSIVNDYNHEIVGEETVNGRLCYKIKMTAKPEADVIWGSRVWWVDKTEFIVLKAELYDEDGYLVRSETGGDLKTFEGRLLPSTLELVPAESQGNKTIVKILDMKFNINLNENFFSQQNMKNVR
jgi:outer membrane lipoprotein-sorting protein